MILAVKEIGQAMTPLPHHQLVQFPVGMKNLIQMHAMSR